jgi:peptidyl-tRNA hydrolase
MATNYLCILMRTDMTSLGRGKSVAQGCHAANAFMWDEVFSPSISGGKLNVDAVNWSQEANGFGTTICLGADIKEIQKAVTLAKALGFAARMVVDPEYPLVDGATFHILPNVETCAYIFGDKEELRIILGNLNLLENDPV